jgi:hypothetical protein
MVKNILKIQKEYEKDFYAWTTHNAKLLRERKLSEIDIENIAEEIECMGKNERRELLNRLAILMAHLLKWKFQAARRSKSWMLTIKNQRMELNELLEDSPSLKKELETKFSHAYEKAILIAAEQTGCDEKAFPRKPPFTLKECFKSSYLPD